MKATRLLKTAVALLGAYAALLMLSLFFGQYYVEICLPLYRWELAWLAPEYRTLSLGIIHPRGESLIGWSVATEHALVVWEKTLPAGVSMSASTLLGHALQHPVLMYALLLAWPGLPFSRRFMSLLIGLPFLLLIEMLDIPLVLLGSIQDLILANLAPAMLSESPLLKWMSFLNSGGRLALSLAAAVLTVSCTNALASIIKSSSKRHAEVIESA